LLQAYEQLQQITDAVITEPVVSHSPVLLHVFKYSGLNPTEVLEHGGIPKAKFVELFLADLRHYRTLEIELDL